MSEKIIHCALCGLQVERRRDLLVDFKRGRFRPFHWHCWTDQHPKFRMRLSTTSTQVILAFFVLASFLVINLGNAFGFEFFYLVIFVIMCLPIATLEFIKWRLYERHLK